MAWFQDLSPCTYFGEDHASFLRAVGWLERGKQFSTGEVNPEVFTRLDEFVKDPWQPILLMGSHRCDLCLYKADVSSHKNVFVPGNGIVYVCPEAITHYMNVHWYKPPDDFQSGFGLPTDAVNAIPQGAVGKWCQGVGPCISNRSPDQRKEAST
jgi:hypothetical protein